MSISLPKIAVVGAGAVGCYFGGLFAKAGFPVTLIAREHQVALLNDEGLKMVWENHDETVPVFASTQYSALADAAYVLIAVKSQATLSTAEQIAPHLKSNAVLLSLQNGLDNASLLKTHISQTCFSAMVYAAIAMSAPNEVTHFGAGHLVIGNTIPGQNKDRLNFLSEMLRLAKIPNKVSETMLEVMWEKLIINCVFNALSAIAQINYSHLMLSPGILELADQIKLECLLIAKLEGVILDEQHISDAIVQIPIHMSQQHSSTAQDLAKGKATEIDYLNGAIVEKGKQHGIPTPINQMLYTLIKMREFTQGNFNPSSPVRFD